MHLKRMKSEEENRRLAFETMQTGYMKVSLVSILNINSCTPFSKQIGHIGTAPFFKERKKPGALVIQF